MNLLQIESFIHVAESRSFSRASAIVGLTVSRQTGGLERKLRQRLLHRNGRSAELTETILADGVAFCGKSCVKRCWAHRKR